MHNDQLPAFRAQILGLRDSLLAQISQQRGGLHSRAEVAEAHFAHPEDSPAQVATERDLEFALNERETADLGALDAALARIDAGRFGHCTQCGSHIAMARLQATPQAARCMDCQQAAERQHAA